MRGFVPYWMPALQALLLSLLCCVAPARAVTYSSSTTPFNLIDSSAHAKLGYNTAPYKFNTGNNSTKSSPTFCPSTPPNLDDTISDALPIGFTFMFAGVGFNSVRVMSNGRLQFNNNITCSYGTPVQIYPFPDVNMNYTMRIYGNDLDPSSTLEMPSKSTNCSSRASCYVSYATIGSAPYRSFVVTWMNVPEWTTATSAVGSYTLQLILQENGEFVYQYGNAVPGPQAKLGQVGWQADTSDYDTPQTGFPVSNSAIKFYIPRPVLEYRMEQPSWSNAASGVSDTSGNGMNGTVLGAPQTIAPGRVCRGASFPLNTSAAAIDAIDSGLSIPGSASGAGTITFWYKAATAWSGTGARDAQLLDATQVNGQWFFLTRRSNGTLRFVITDSSGTVRSADTPAIAVAAATWKHIAVSWSFNALGAANSDHLRIYVDGVLQKETAFTTSTVMSMQIGTLYIGDNRSAVIGQNGSANSTDGAIDELRAYNYEGGLALVQRDQNQSQAGCLNHYAVSHSGNGLTCQQSIITVTAHDSTHANIVMPNNTTQIQLSTSNGIGDWSLVNGYGVLNNDTAGDGIATYLFNGEYQAVFALSSGTATTVTVNVSDGQFVEVEDPPLVIKACTVAKFNACEVSSPRCVPSSSSLNYARLYTKLADTAFKLDLVKVKNDATLETAFNGTATVDLLLNTASGVALGANNCPVSQTAVVPLGLISFSGGYSSANLSIAANALSAVTPKYSAYRDVRVRMTCTAASCGTANVGCSTDSFAVRPATFSLASNMNNAVLSSTPKLGAGLPFTITATAVAGYDGQPLLDNTAAGKKIYTHLGAGDNTVLVSNGSGASPFALGQAALASGVASSSNVIYNDVGTFSIGADGVFDNQYSVVDSPADCILGSSSNSAVGGKFGCNIGSPAPALTVGRFVPHHFDVSGSLTPACNGFTYMGQAGLQIALVAGARSAAGSQAPPHYTTGYPALATVSVSGLNGSTVFSPLNNRLTPDLPAFAWVAGVAGANPALYSFDRLASGQDGPYESFMLVTAISDPDGAKVASVNGAAVAPAASGTIGPTVLRHGRLRIDNVYGSERRALPVGIAAQYWNGLQYVLNALDDKCTALLQANFVMEKYINMTAGQAPPFNASAPLANGVGTARLGAPAGAAMTKKGSFLLRSLIDYLPGSGRETFGEYTNAPLIFMREVY